MKTEAEIREFCQTKCEHTDCKGKHLRLAKKARMFCGCITTPKGEWYCTYHESHTEAQRFHTGYLP